MAYVQNNSADNGNSTSEDGKVSFYGNSKGNGFDLFVYDGMHLYPIPEVLLKGGNDTEKLKNLKNAEMKDDDVIICAYPKCGTHWLWEVLEMLRSGTIQYQENAKETRMLELIFKEGIEEISSPRILNTHLPLRMLPTQVEEKKLKCIQIMRNPKDVCVSWYHHLRNMNLPGIVLNGGFEEFIEMFLSGELPFGSYHKYLHDWYTEVKERGLPTLDLYYEDMKKNPVKCIKQIADFIEERVTEKFCEDIAKACSFKKMKKVDEEMKKGFPKELWKEGPEGTFYRKGEVGDWKNWFTVSESERFDQIWNAKMKNLEIAFTYS